MTTNEALNIVEEFKKLIIELINGRGNRSLINQNVVQVKKITRITCTHKTLTISPPPMVGGPIMQDVDPLDILFSAPYGMDFEIYNLVVDNMDETIGVLKANPNCIEQFEEKKKVQDECKIVQQNITNMEKQQTPKIFISHKTEDANYAKAIIDMLIVLGVKHRDIFCSSVPGYGIPFGKSIVDTLHNQFDSYNLFVIFIHSPRYYNSAVSLNEMGAAWILRSKHLSFLTKDCSYSMLTGVINGNEIAFKAGKEDTEHLLNDFRHEIRTFFSLEDIPNSVWDITKRDFIEKVKSFNYGEDAGMPTKKGSTFFPNSIISKHISSEDLIIGYLKQVGKEMRMNEISSETGLSMAMTYRTLKKLINERIVVHTGNSRYGKFKLAE